MTVGVQEPPGLVAARPVGVRDPRGWGVIAIPAALAAVLSLIGLSARSLGFDEGAASIAAQHGAAPWHAIAHDGGNISGSYLFMHVLTGAFGDGLVVPPSLVVASCGLGRAGSRSSAASASPTRQVALARRRAAPSAGLPLSILGPDGGLCADGGILCSPIPPSSR
jgi:hypothetical protein